MVSSQNVKGKGVDTAVSLHKEIKAGKENGKTEQKNSSENKKSTSGKSGATKVSISEKGRKIAKSEAEKTSDENDSEESLVEDPVVKEEKKNDLVNFYAKQLMKATDKLEKETVEKAEEAPESEKKETTT